jgi:hypothetical protein
MSEQADWITPGATVYVLGMDYGRYRSWRRTTIDRVLKRDVVTASGDRFRLVDARPDQIVSRSQGTWSGASSVLVPEASKRATEAQREVSIAKARNEALGLVEDLRRGAMGEASSDLARRAAAALTVYADTVDAS